MFRCVPEGLQPSATLPVLSPSLAPVLLHSTGRSHSGARLNTLLVSEGPRRAAAPRLPMQPPMQSRQTLEGGVACNGTCTKNPWTCVAHRRWLNEPRRKHGLLSVPHKRRSAQKAQEENWLVSGPKDHGSLPVTKECNAKMTCGYRRQQGPRLHSSAAGLSHVVPFRIA